MKYISKVAVSFPITLVLGMIVWRLALPTPQTIQSIEVKNYRFEVLSVPKIDFTDGAKNSLGLQASVKLRAEVGSDGKVRSVSPALMVPHGAYDERIRQYYPTATHALMNGRFVDELPYQLTRRAISLTRDIRFSATRRSHTVMLVIEFNVTEPLGWPMCNQIFANIYDDSSELWKGNVSVYPDCSRSNGSQ